MPTNNISSSDREIKASELAFVTVSEARKIMGEDSNSMTDEDIQRAIFDLTSIARMYIKTFPKYDV